MYYIFEYHDSFPSRVRQFVVHSTGSQKRCVFTCLTSPFNTVEHILSPKNLWTPYCINRRLVDAIELKYAGKFKFIRNVVNDYYTPLRVMEELKK